MKYVIASDIHGSAFFCRELLNRFQEEKADQLVLLGDLLYHGPRNDLPKEYAPKEVLAMLNQVKERIVCVRGNCDAEVDQMVLEFPIMAEFCLIEMQGHTIFATHGHHYNTASMPLLRTGDVLLHGHTHVPAYEQTEQGIWYLNPGSVSIPKAESPESYMTLEDGKFLWKNLSGEVYHELDLSQ